MTEEVKHIAVVDSSGFVLRVVKSASACPPGEASASCVELPDWKGWPQAPFESAQLRLVGGELIWVDIRTSAEKDASARARRDSQLRASDWTQVRDAPLTAAQVTAWASWRQQLRDLPAHPSWPGMAWPTQPAL